MQVVSACIPLHGLQCILGIHNWFGVDCCMVMVHEIVHGNCFDKTTEIAILAAMFDMHVTLVHSDYNYNVFSFYFFSSYHLSLLRNTLQGKMAVFNSHQIAVYVTN